MFVANNCGKKMTKPLPVERIRESFLYDPATGVFMRRWRKWTPAMKTGSFDRRGYVVLCLDNQRFAGHRVAWLLGHGEDPGKLEIDHINGNPRDNRLSNLRLATETQNKWNIGARSSNGSGLKGVFRLPGGTSWSAKIQHHKKIYYLGRHKTPMEAHQAYTRAATALHGEFANPGTVAK